MSNIDKINAYLALQTQPDLFSQPITPILLKSTAISQVHPKTFKSPPSTKCVFCQFPALPHAKFCAHHFPASANVARCAFPSCSEPALLGCYADAVGVSFCKLHENSTEFDGKTTDFSVKFEEQPLKELPEIGFGVNLEVEKVVVDVAFCEAVVDSILNQILVCMRSYE
ncbi:hypothetical protein SS50377_28222 [Spironucleus salmonicida]|uniref:Uncharacterized protein n=1 Tax=Spironucleus salmonicida TaxID=348837 RepID=V6M4W9_9EUKA|nr:hypothetical protein SS50377_28222 [Spironucleus salmonicida]|eukprot:EST48404.1 Hypothetical protein SS50377_11352 [Spironucleus salmonicida]